jgi:hypothetical protein
MDVGRDRPPATDAAARLLKSAIEQVCVCVCVCVCALCASHPLLCMYMR